MHVFSLAADQIESAWDAMAPLLAIYEKRCQDLSPEQIRRAALESKQQIFGLQDEACRIHGLVVTEIQVTSRGLTCVLVAACGTAKPEYKREILDRIREWAKELGCVTLRIQGRKGWLRWDRRFKQTGITMECPL